MDQGFAMNGSSFTQFSSNLGFSNNIGEAGLYDTKKLVTEDIPLQGFQVERRKRQELNVALQEKERQRIAMELHDGLGQALTLMKLELMNTTALLPADMVSYNDAKESLQRLKSRLHYAFDELRRAVSDLRPSMIDDLGILPTLSWVFREFQASTKTILLQDEIAVLESQVPYALKITIFRILQEAINNAVKHAAADRIYVSFKKNNNTLDLIVEDNGQGFDPVEKGTFRRTSGGIAGIIERVRSSGGEWLIESGAGSGTRIHVSWKCISPGPALSESAS